jgi:hypothetical protein
VSFDDPLRYREPKAGPVQFGREERVEDVGKMFRWDSWSPVGHLDDGTVTVGIALDANLGGLWTRLDPVQEHVEEYLPDLFGIHPYVGQRLTNFVDEGNASTLGFGPQEKHHVLDNIIKADRPKFRRVRPRVIQELLHEFIEAFYFPDGDGGKLRLRCSLNDLTHDNL